jgi:hypothetical protein
MTELAQRQTSPLSVEERLQPWIDQGEYIILLVLGLMAWSAGWVDLLGFQSPQNPILFGRYSLPIFGVIVVYTLGFGAWFWMIGSLRALGLLKRGLAFVQARWWLYALIWLGFIGVIASMFVIDYWKSLPLLEIGVLVLMVIFTVAILLTNPVPSVPMQRWRKIALMLIGALIVFEVVMQLLAQTGAIRANNLSGLTTPYGRVYQTSEGRGDGNTNRFGWYYPDFRLLDGEKRILLSGDTFVQAIQIPMTAHMGVGLEKLLTTAGTPTEVIVQGQLGYGSTMFINPLMYPYIWEPMKPMEIVILFHVANDFQLSDPALDQRPKYMVNAEGKAVVVDADFAYWHTMAHRVIAGHDPANPIRTVLSQSMAVQSILNWTERLRGQDGLSPNRQPFTAKATYGQPFGTASVMFETAQGKAADEAYALFTAQLQEFAAFLADKDIKLRLVTIPYFPAEFFSTASGTNWDSTFGTYDLLQPERNLRQVAAANKVPFLGMGEYMQTGATPSDIQALFFDGGKGHLTEAGHAFFAQAMHTCFYQAGAATTSVKGCYPAP